MSGHAEAPRVVWKASTVGEVRYHVAHVNGAQFGFVSRVTWKTLAPWSAYANGQSLGSFVSVREAKAAIEAEVRPCEP